MSLDPQLITSTRCDLNDDTTSSVFSSKHPPSSPVDRNSSDTISPIFQRKRKDRKSFVWLPENGEEYHEKGKCRWRCRRCSNLRSIATFSDASTRNMIDHLKPAHGVTKENPEGLVSQAENRIRTAFSNTLPRITFNQDLFKQLLLRWVTTNNISFRQVEDPTFRYLLIYLCACTSSFTALNKAMPSSGDTIRKWILDAFLSARTDLIHEFQQSHSVVHFSFDVWTSPSHRAFLGVVGHWVDKTGALKAALLGLRRFKGAHSGENQASLFWNVALDLGLTRRIGYFTLDNASNNDTAMEAIQSYHRDMGLPFDPIKRRLRCFGHVINLIVKGFLWGIDPEAFENMISTLYGLEKEKEELMAWRKRGPMGKLHNICVWICKTPQRRDRFEEKVQQFFRISATDPTVPIVGNITRWGGDFNALKRAFLLREPIEEFVAAEIRTVSAGARKCGKDRYRGDENDIELDELSIEDWDELRSIMDILEPFKKWSLKLQGKCRNGALHDILPAMDELLAHLEDAKLRYSDASIHTQHLQTSINIAWNVLNKYDGLVDLTPVHYAAIALHPEMKFEYFEEEWGDRPDWIRTAKEATIALWESEYKCQTPPNGDGSTWKDSEEEPEWKRKKRARLAKDTQDSLQRYLEKEEGDQIDNPLRYWTTKLQDSSSRHKLVASMGAAVHSIPGMSTEVERVFSSTKILISERRNRLGDDIIEASECLKAWQKEQLTPTHHQDIRKMDEMLDDLEERAGSL